MGAAAESREWANDEGQTFEGMLVSIKEGAVGIQRSFDRRIFEVPLEKLSQADRAYVEEEQKGIPAEGELEIFVPHGHKLGKGFEKIEVVLVQEELEDPSNEVVIAKGFKQLSWDAGAHGMVGPVTFKGVNLYALSKPEVVMRFRCVGKWDGTPFDQIGYSKSISLQKQKDGKIHLEKIRVKFRKP